MNQSIEGFVEWIGVQAVGVAIISSLVAFTGIFVLLLERVASVVILFFTGVPVDKLASLYSSSLNTAEFVMVSFASGVFLSIAMVLLLFGFLCSWYVDLD